MTSSSRSPLNLVLGYLLMVPVGILAGLTVYGLTQFTL